jgi:hypothetical protein
VKVVVYVEGGGDKRKILDDCRRGFGQLFEKVVPTLHRPKVIPCGGRGSAFHDFQRGVSQGREGFLILLVDSEGPVSANLTSWGHLSAREDNQLHQPPGTTDEQAHLMVQCMESWFLADVRTLSEYYGQGFLINSFPGRPNIEEIPKRDVEQALDHATRLTQKGVYHKTRHGFELLANIDPAKVRAASGHAQRLFEVLEERARM